MRRFMAAASLIVLAAAAASAAERERPRLDAWVGGGFAVRRDQNSWSAQIDTGHKGRPLYFSVDLGGYRKRRDLSLVLFEGAAPHRVRVHSSNQVTFARFLLTYVHDLDSLPLKLRLGGGLAAHYITSLRETRDLNVVTGAETLLTTEIKVTAVRPALSAGLAYPFKDRFELRLTGDYEVPRRLLFPSFAVGGLSARIGLHARFL